MNFGLKIKINKQTKETLWAFTAKAIAVLGGIFFTIFIPKFAGVDVYGSLSLTLAYVSLFGVLAGTQLNSAIKRDVVEHKAAHASKNILLEALKLKALLSLTSSAFIVGLLALINITVLKQHLGHFIILLVLMNTWGLLMAFFESLHRLVFEAMAYVVEYGTQVALILIFYFTHHLTLDNILLSFIAGYGLSLLISLIFAGFILRGLPRVARNIFSIEKAIASRLLARAFFLSLAALSLIVMLRIDTIMISFFLGIEAVGFYAIAGDIAKNAAIISIPIILGAMPSLPTENGRKFLNKNLLIVMGINLPILLGLLFFSKLVVTTIYGPHFETTIKVLQLLAAYPLLAGMQALVQEVLILKERTRDIFIFGVFAIGANIILNAVLIPRIGIAGAAIGTTAAYILWFLISLRKARKVLS